MLLESFGLRMSIKSSEETLQVFDSVEVSAARDVRLQHLKNGHHMFVTMKRECSEDEKHQALFLVPEELLTRGSSLKASTLEIQHLSMFCTAQNEMRNRSWERSL